MSSRAICNTVFRWTGAETHSNVIQGNYIGLSSQGSGGIGHQLFGIFLQGGANHNVIGGSSPGEGNTVSGNDVFGIVLYNADSNYLSGNFIGTSPDGGSAQGNTYGINLVGTSSGNVIGGDTPGLGNIISGNTVMGISLEADANTIQGNIVGLAADGQTPLPNRTGIYLAKSNNTIGGTLPAHRNIISGNLDHGILISALETDPLDASNNVISGNYIGTDRSGRTAVGNRIRPLSGPPGGQQHHRRQHTGVRATSSPEIWKKASGWRADPTSAGSTRSGATTSAPTTGASPPGQPARRHSFQPGGPKECGRPQQHHRLQRRKRRGRGYTQHHQEHDYTQQHFRKRRIGH